ncbi:MAG: hypothetical protein P8J32_08290 [bacterium]|nr:hypothetical protein [bacterium]
MPSGCTIQNIYPADTPNEGRVKINDNFECLATGSVTGFSGSFFTNPSATTETVGGIQAGTTFPSQYDLQQMFDLLLYPFQEPAFSAFAIQGQSNSVEVGTALSGTKTFTWTTTNSSNVDANTLAIEDTTNASTLGSSLTDDSSEALALGATIQKSTPATHVWTIAGTDTQASEFSRTLTISWLWKMFYGTSTNTTLNESQIEALANDPLSSVIAGTYSLAAGGYKYFCVPDSFSNIITIVDDLTGLSVAMADSSDGYSSVANGFNYQTVSVTNGNGQTTNYRVYRTKNILGASIDITIT